MFRPALAVVLSLPAVALSGVALGSSAGAAAAAPATATCHGVPATIVGTSGDDRLVGTDGPDVIVGLGGNDQIWGAQGDDRVCGGVGADDLAGGDGADRLYGGPGHRVRRHDITFVNGDRLDGGPGDDLLAAHADYGRMAAVRRPDTVTYRDSDGPVQVALADRTVDGAGHDTIVGIKGLRVLGSGFDDVMTGSARSDYFDGGAGNDRLSGRGGRDTLLDRSGDDVLTGGLAGDVVFSGGGADKLIGQDGRDLLGAIGTGSATAQGGPGGDFVIRALESGTSDVLDGGPGSNMLHLVTFAPGDTEPAVGVDRLAGTAVVQDGSTTTTTNFSGFGSFILLGPATWNFQGTDEADEVQVGIGSLNASTFGGDDFLAGDRRDDTFDGGDGTDTAFGGGGTNTCLNTEKGKCNGSQVPFRTPARPLAAWPQAAALRDVPGVRRLLEAVRAPAR